MYEEKKKKLRKFVKPHHEEYIGGIWFIVIGITGVVFGIMEHDYQTTFFTAFRNTFGRRNLVFRHKRNLEIPKKDTAYRGQQRARDPDGRF